MELLKTSKRTIVHQGRRKERCFPNECIVHVSSYRKIPVRGEGFLAGSSLLDDNLSSSKNAKIECQSATRPAKAAGMDRRDSQEAFILVNDPQMDDFVPDSFLVSFRSKNGSNELTSLGERIEHLLLHNDFSHSSLPDGCRADQSSNKNEIGAFEFVRNGELRGAQ